MFILIKSFFWMCWMDFDYSHERTEVRRDYCFSVDTCHCALLIYRNYTGPWISLWETRNCPGIFPTTSSFIESFLQRRQSWRHLSYYITNMPFSQPHHTSMMNLPRNMLCQPQIVLYYLTQKKLAKKCQLLYIRGKQTSGQGEAGESKEASGYSAHMIWEMRKGNIFKNFSKLRSAWRQLRRHFHVAHCLVHTNNLFCWTESLLAVSQHPLIANWAT